MNNATKENFRSSLEKLTKQFSQNEAYYKSKEYKEDQARQEFINPFFRALGWDMDNEQGFAPQYREVIHEDRIQIDGKPKAPDYSFKVGSDRKFFVEAKAPAGKIFSELEGAFQLRRYAWSGKLPVSILTDFEELAVYDTTIEPKTADKASVARVKYIKFTDYLKEIDYLWETFSKEAVWNGSFDKFAKKEKKGSQLVDKSFLKEIELWRDLLAKDIAKNNKLDIHELNLVVQKLIDRLIFLRIAEDRGIETYETLKGTIKPKNTYSLLLKIFKRADDKYNSSLFDFEKDEISTKVKVSDNVLDRILTNLYYPKSPFEFSIIGVDILGSVYEQFLGKVIRLTRGGNAVIEEKPEVKKAGGVYYTPQYIVEYIVKNTVGELVKDKTPRAVSTIKIVDPACGSGSFLIGAYEYLLEWHLKYYVENNPERHVKNKTLFKDSEGNYFLSTQEKKRILTNNIYGVDIDPQAVEVTKLSLALKVLEGENSETIGAQFVLFAERILPDLRSNIKCGNSLIGSDYYEDKQISLMEDDEIREINAFDWEKEFENVFKYGGGFDAVIGNPPYIKKSKTAFLFKKGKLGKYYEGRMDLWYAFACHSIDIVKKGWVGKLYCNK
jgi:type I restriction-modification system DNA methylase subunit